MGTSLGLLGAGGATLAIPILIYFFGIAPYHATVYSLIIVGICAGFAAVASVRSRLVSWTAFTYYLLPLLFGMTVARRLVLPALPGGPTRDLVILWTLVLLMFGASLTMIRKRGPEKRHEGKFGLKRKLGLVASGLAVGSIAGLAGAGGGFLIVPSLVMLTGLPIKLAVGTSLVLISLNSLYGFALEWETFQTLDQKLFWQFLGIGIAGMVFGIRLNRRLKPERIRVAFGWLLLIVASWMAFDQVFSVLWPSLLQKPRPISESSANRAS